MDEHPEEAKTAADGQAGVMGLAGSLNLLGAQTYHQPDYRREQALTFALQANGGNAPYSVAQLISDADAILSWLAPKAN